MDYKIYLYATKGIASNTPIVNAVNNAISWGLDKNYVRAEILPDLAYFSVFNVEQDIDNQLKNINI